MSALDAYPLQAGAAYVIGEITIASNTTFKRFETGLVFFNWISRYNRCLQILAMSSICMTIPMSDCNQTPNSFADKTLPNPGSVVGNSRFVG